MLFPETENRTIRVPLQWIDGQWQIEGGGELPKVSEKACADLVMPASFLVDADEIRQWTSEAEVDLLDEGTELFMRVNPNNVPQEWWEACQEKDHSFGAASRFVSVILREPLRMILTPGKKGRLRNCKCEIPALKKTAESLNEAYKKIITLLEPVRRSVSGNVFLRAFVERQEKLVQLDVLRNEVSFEAAVSPDTTRETNSQPTTDTRDSIGHSPDRVTPGTDHGIR